MRPSDPGPAPFASMEEAQRLAPLILALYRAGLDRAPDAVGLAGLVAALRRGMGWDQAAAGILESTEFRQHAPQGLRDELARQAAAAGVSPAEALVRRARQAVAAQARPLFAQLFPQGAKLDDAAAYRLWIEAYGTLSGQDEQAIRARLGQGPRVSVCLTLGDGPVLPALHSIRALHAQIHADWQLCLAVPPGRDAALQDALRRAGLEAVQPVGTTLDQAIAAATGAFLTVLDPGDALAPEALAELALALRQEPDLDMVFADEDSIGAGGLRAAPRFKPGWSPEPLRVMDSVGRPAFLRRSRMTATGTPLEMIRQVALGRPEAVRHIPAVLLHRAAPAPLETRTVPAAFTGPAPLVSIIIPTRDRADLLGPCIEGILHRTDHQALEILLVDTGSTEDDALALLRRLEAEPRIRLLHRPGPFNWSATNNQAVTESKGEVLLFLNNDTLVTQPGWLGELAGQARRPGIGVVGARLLYPDGRLQHGGVALGPEGRATHIQRFAAGTDPGYLSQLAVVRDVGAVTGACMAMSRAAFDALGGFEAEHLTLEWSDIEICIRARAHGYRVLYTPHAELLHLESATRADAGSAERIARFQREQGWVMQRWPAAMRHDPFLNPNLLATDDDIVLAPAPRMARSWCAGG
ncbi:MULTISPECIES: glycosyltransferase family 2 protein [Roseomonadaceae]|uniref:Glycosyltransferase family 2 protein n=1 Tax=Falsiroseomonas oleicola TaxID=2801474 RepID=A0ABS6H6H5_9PROT|nr:glycosyltransferase family 2 protein [Roseomonas oleicola]MBU8544295.1 glycosyltransferase family 2 protein [Roseomonas oleicola]